MLALTRTCTLAALALVLAATAITAPARAQGRRWAVIAATSSREDAPRARELAEHARGALLADGETVLDPARVVARLDESLAAPFVAAPDELAARVARAAEVVLDDVSFDRNERALATGEPVLAELAAHVVALGRIDAGREAGNLCLYLARADLQSGQTERARERVLECMRLVPDVSADDARLHPRVVTALVRELRDEHAAGRAGGVLSVTASEGDPEGCGIRVNGRVLGRTPWIREPLPVGRYGVQVECGAGAPGRVFVAEVRAAEVTRLVVPVRLVAAVDTDDGPALVHDDGADLDAELAREVGAVAHMLDASHVLVALADEQLALRVYAVGDDPEARLTGSAPVGEMSDRATREAVQAARSGRRQADPTATPQSRGGDVGVAVLGGSLLAVGLVGLGLGVYFWTEVDARGQELNRAVSSAQLVDRQRAFDDSSTPMLVSSVAGSTLSVVGAALLTSQADEAVPWWSWVFGAAGVGVGAAGIYVLTTEGTCYGNPTMFPCARRSPTWLLGTYVLSWAAPLLTVSITSWIRAAVGADARATLAADTDGARFVVFGSF